MAHFHCKKCPYFEKTKQELKAGTIIMGFCKLRQKHVSDVSINKEQCKDRAVINL
jgi:hypothetical protein